MTIAKSFFMRSGRGGDIFGILGILRLLDRREKERDHEK
jgi:hypothetical protein